MLNTLENRLIALFSAFALLVLISVGATTWGLETQRQDAVLINLSGRQRMLAQQMARLAFEAGASGAINNAALQESEQIFGQTLSALKDGGSVPYLPQSPISIPGTQDPQLRSALGDVEQTWGEYQILLDRLQQPPGDDPAFALTLAAVEQTSSTLVQQADVVVRLYEAASTAKVNRLRAIQISFLACALALLAAGAWITRQSVLLPLRQLSRAAKRLGENDLDTVVAVEGPVELRELSKSFDATRLSLRSSRQELLQLNTSLEERVARRTRELETLNEVSRDISSRLDIQQVLNSVTEKARSLLGSEVASLCLVDESQHWMKLQAVSGPESAVAGHTVCADEDLAGAVLKSEQALVCGLGACRGGCRMMADPYKVSHLAAPLRIGERVIGALCVGSVSQDRFAVESAEMLTKLANAAAIALENARLYAQAEKVATLEERRRVAADMHDGLGQTLSYLGLMTDQVVEFLSAGRDGAALEHLQKTRQTIQSATAEVRRAINNLMSDSPSALDLCTRLHNIADEFAAEHNLPVSWYEDSAFAPRPERKVADQVLNITREALTNVARHAEAHKATLQVGNTAGHYYVSVQDDGHGFDATQPGPSGHFGLQIMKSRAMLVGGQLEVESAPGRGTRVTLIWPMGKDG